MKKMTKTCSAKRKNTLYIKASKVQKSKHAKTVTITIQPMMPNGYTATQRERLKAFERSIMTK